MKSYKKQVLSLGQFVLDYSEILRDRGRPFWYIGRGLVAGNTSPIPSGLHHSPRMAWEAAFYALKPDPNNFAHPDDYSRAYAKWKAAGK